MKIDIPNILLTEHLVLHLKKNLVKLRSQATVKKKTN